MELGCGTSVAKNEKKKAFFVVTDEKISLNLLFHGKFFFCGVLLILNYVNWLESYDIQNKFRNALYDDYMEKKIEIHLKKKSCITSFSKLLLIGSVHPYATRR